MPRITKAALEGMAIRDQAIHCLNELWTLRHRVADLEERCRELLRKVCKK